MTVSLQDKIFYTKNENFEETVWDVFHFQQKNNAVYRSYTEYLGISPNNLTTLQQIPFLPIDFFKQHIVVSSEAPVQKTFLSSSTTGTGQSRHLVTDLAMYETAFNKGFELFYGQPGEYCILALLPSYLERDGSSLVYMADKLIQQSAHPHSGFYLNEWNKLAQVLRQNEAAGQKTLLLGVSFALLDFAEAYPMPLKNTLLMETGGMKGRREEITRQQLHAQLTSAFGTACIHSEYGMTELLSQAYSVCNGRFTCPPWMKVLVRTADDPFGYTAPGKTGGINVIDLANLYSCAFIETADLGRAHPDGTFEVLGRFDFSETRGCNTMVG